MVVRDLSKMSGQLKSGGFRPVMQADREKRVSERMRRAGISVIPLYRQISDNCWQGIREGKFPVGTFLPGELDLIDRFEASRHTIREALRVSKIWAGQKTARQGHAGTLHRGSPAFVQMVRSPSELFSYPDSSLFRLLSDDRIIRLTRHSRGSWAVRLGDEWVQISGLRTLGP